MEWKILSEGLCNQVRAEYVAGNAKPEQRTI